MANKTSNKRVKIAPFGRWDAQKARALYPYRYVCMINSLIMKKYIHSIIKIFILVPMLCSCSTLQHVRYNVAKVKSAHMDRAKNLYICVEGKIEKASQDYSKHTIMIPLSNDKLHTLDAELLQNQMNGLEPSFFDSHKIYGIKLNTRYFSSDCLPKAIISKMKRVKVISNLATPEISKSDYGSFQTYWKEYKKKENSYLAQMQPDDENGVLYQLHSNPGKYLYALVYVEKNYRFNGVNKIGFNFSWHERGFSLINTVMSPITVPVATFLYLESELLSQ